MTFKLKDYRNLANEQCYENVSVETENTIGVLGWNPNRPFVFSVNGTEIMVTDFKVCQIIKLYF